MPSQMVWASSTLMAPGTTRWKSMKVMRPAWRVRMSCASIAPSALVAMTSRMVCCTSAGTATSMSPPTLSRTTAQPDQRMLRATSAARIGSSTAQPVRTTNPRPTRTPAVDTTSVIRCRPSASIAGERALRPCRISTRAQTMFTIVAAAPMPRPSAGASGISGASSPSQASRKIRMAAMMIITPTSTAEKYSALW